MLPAAAKDSPAASRQAAPVHVVFCANQAYLQHMAVAAVSLAQARRGGETHIHLFTCDALPGAEKLVRSLRAYPHVTLRIHRIADPRLEGAHVDRYLTKECYLRFLAADILPPEVSRAIYLDSDLVVLDDVGDLAGADLQGRAVGAVPDCDWTALVPDGRLAGLGLGPDHVYVNSGVLVLDLDRWRRDGLADRIFRCTEDFGSRLAYHDQDALNIVLQGDIQPLDRRWNLQVLMYSRWIRSALPADFRASADARQNPAILHYSTGDKPWKHRAWVRKKALYFRFLDQTAWADDAPPAQGLGARLEYRLAHALLRAGVDVYALRPVCQRVNRAFGRARMRLQLRS